MPVACLILSVAGMSVTSSEASPPRIASFCWTSGSMMIVVLIAALTVTQMCCHYSTGVQDQRDCQKHQRRACGQHLVSYCSDLQRRGRASLYQRQPRRINQRRDDRPGAGAQVGG